MTIFGVDCSDFDWDRGPMDIAAMARDQISFLTHKASEGSTNRHQHYGTVLNRARAAGIPILGAYHVVRSGPTVPAQVNWFLSYLDQATPWWRSVPFLLQVDLEKWPYDPVTAGRGMDFGRALRAATGRPVVIYASKGQYGNDLAAWDGPLWNARYPSSARGHYREMYPGDGGSGWAPYSGKTPAIWQYASTATIGSQPTCDANAFRGTLADFAALIGAANPTPAVTTMGDTDMHVLVKTADSPTVWLADGTRRVAIVDEDHLAAIRQVHDGTLLPKLGNSGNIFVTGVLDAWGVPDPTPTATISDAQIQAIAQKLVASAANGLTAADHAGVVADLKQALREGAS